MPIKELERDDRKDAVDFLTVVRGELDAYESAIDFDALSDAKKMICASEAQGGRVHVTGIGKPGHVAGYVASLFSSIGTAAYVLDGTEAVHGSSGQVRAGDVVIAISNSGETSELKATVNTLKRNGASIISVTRAKDSWLAENSDVVLCAGVTREGDEMNKPPRASILAEVIELQCLSILLQNNRQLTPEQYVAWHPGGALGQSIRNGQ